MAFIFFREKVRHFPHLEKPVNTTFRKAEKAMVQIKRDWLDTAYELLDDIEAKWLKKHKPKNPNSFTEQLQLRTQTRMMAEEIVIVDVVMQFH